MLEHLRLLLLPWQFSPAKQPGNTIKSSTSCPGLSLPYTFVYLFFSFVSPWSLPPPVLLLLKRTFVCLFRNSTYTLYFQIVSYPMHNMSLHMTIKYPRGTLGIDVIFSTTQYKVNCEGLALKCSLIYQIPKCLPYRPLYSQRLHG